jgi:hypothetical protein
LVDVADIATGSTLEARLGGSVGSKDEKVGTGLVTVVVEERHAGTLLSMVIVVVDAEGSEGFLWLLTR